MSDRSDLALLSEWLRHLDLRVEVFARHELCGAWQINTGISQRCTFHALVHGRAWLQRQGCAAEPLQAGDVVFVAPGQWHCLTAEASSLGADPVDTETPATAGAGPGVGLVCGWIDTSDGSLGPLLSAVSDVMVLGARTETPSLRGLGVLLQALATAPDEEDEVLLRHLAELLLLLVARQLLAGERAAGLLAALRDPRLRRVLACVQRDPAQPWTLESMAALAHMSRTAFALHFHHSVGETPAAFVRRWRMLHARRLLQRGSLSVTQVAEACGYRSESAFRRAYGREAQLLVS